MADREAAPRRGQDNPGRCWVHRRQQAASPAPAGQAWSQTLQLGQQLFYRRSSQELLGRNNE